MPLFFSDRVRETTTTTGTGTLNLAGAVTGCQTFVTGIGTGKQCYYAIIHQSAAEWEVGIGTITDATPDTLSRTTVLASSNGDSAVNFSSGTKDVICTAGGDACSDMVERIDVNFTAGEALSARDFVFVSAADGKVYKANVDDINAGLIGWFVGFATESVAINNPVAVRVAGVMDGYTSLTPGATQYTQNGKAYIAGGFSSARVDTTHKSVFTTEVNYAVPSANISQARMYSSGCSDGSSKGYITGGDSSANVTTADKITYDDVAFAKTTANLSQARQALTGVSQWYTNGYITGGATGASAVVATAEKVTFSNDTTTAQTTANLTQARMFTAGCSEGSTKGYFAGGATSASVVVTTADKITFSNDTTTAQTTANLTQARNALAGVSEGSTKGYFAGGSTNLSTGINTADKVTFSSDATTAQTTANLTSNRGWVCGYSEGATKGFFSAGYTSAAVATTDKLTYSSDTTAAQTTMNLSQAKYGPSAVDVNSRKPNITESQMSNLFITGVATSSSDILINNRGKQEAVYFGGEKGYFAGGSTNAAVATVYKTLFASNTTSTLSGTLSQARLHLMACASFGEKCYILGGTTGAGVLNTADKITVVNDTIAAQSSANLTQARQGAGACSERYRKGYVSGGHTGAIVATGNMIVFASDTTVAQTTANLSQARYILTGLSNLTYKGYFTGGWTSASVATTDKINFSNDTTAAQTTANLSTVKWGPTGVSEGLTKGYVAGGASTASVYVATTDKITFADDVRAAQASANLSQARAYAAGCSQGTTKAYFAGGETASAAEVTTVDNLIFASDTTAVQSTAILTTATLGMAGVSDVAL